MHTRLTDVDKRYLAARYERGYHENVVENVKLVRTISLLLPITECLTVEFSNWRVNLKNTNVLLPWPVSGRSKDSPFKIMVF